MEGPINELSNHRWCCELFQPVGRFQRWLLAHVSHHLRNPLTNMSVIPEETGAPPEHRGLGHAPDNNCLIRHVLTRATLSIKLITQTPSTNTITMKKLILIAISAASISAYGLPTYEPFTEYASQIASSPINLVVTYANGTPVGTNANAGITNCLDLATGGYTAPGEVDVWGVLNFSGTAGGNSASAGYHGLDIAVVTNNNIFT